jgi:hypothetical protein
MGRCLWWTCWRLRGEYKRIPLGRTYVLLTVYLGMPRRTCGHVSEVCLHAYICSFHVLTPISSCEFSALKIFGFGDGNVDIDGEAGDVLYASYLSMARSGLVSLEMWDPKSQKWGQPHCQARFAILKVYLPASYYVQVLTQYP